MSKEQVYIAKGNAPWFTDSNYYWMPWVDEDKFINMDESISGQATVTCKGVTNMGSMFNECHCITSLDLSNFNTSEVTNMRNMFAYCYNLASLDLSNFDTSKVKDMFNMFHQCSSLTSLDLSSFDTSNVTDMSFMLSGCSKLTSLDLSNFNTSNVRDMGLMFSKCTSLTSLDVTNFDTSNVENMLSIFDGCSNLTTIKGVIDMKSCKRYSDMFMNCTKLKGVKIKNPPDKFEKYSRLSKSQYTIVDDEYDHKLAFLSTGSAPWYSKIWADESHVIDILEFSGQANVIIDDKITNMEYMFHHCSGLTSLDLFTYFNTSKVTNMSSMFNSCRSLTTLDLSGFNTSKVTNMSFMFFNCHGLTSLDLSSFNTSNVDDMECMFGDCTSLTTLDLSNFDTSKVKNMSYMFKNCYNLTTIKGIIDMKSCKWCTDMFKNCPKLKDVKIKNPPTSFNEHWVGLSSSQYTVVDDESDSLKRRNIMFKTTGIEPIDGIDAPINIYRAPGFSTEKISINYIPSSMQNDAPKYDKATQEFDGEKEKDNKEAMNDFNKAVKELSNKLDEIVGKNTEGSSPKEEEVSKETKAEDHKHTNEEKVQETINKQRPNSNKYNKMYYILTEFIYQRDFIPAFLWFMEHAYNNVLIAHQHKRRSYKIYKEIVKGGNLIGKCNISESNNEHCYFVLDGSNRSLNDYNYNRQRKAAKLLAKYIIASNTVPYVLNLKYYLENFGDPYSDYAPTGTSSVMKRTFTEVYVKTLEKVCFGKDF